MILSHILLARLMGRLHRDPEPGVDGGGDPNDPGDFGDMAEVTLGDESADEPEEGTEHADDPGPDADATQAEADDPGPDVNPDDPDEEWTEGEATIKAKRSELRKAYAQHQATQQRAAALAPRETQVSQQLQQLATQQQQQLVHGQAIAAFLQQEVQRTVPPAELAQTDPGRYVALNAQHQERVQALQRAMQGVQHQQTVHQQTLAAQQQQRLALEESQLLTAVPEWRDPVARKAEGTRITAYLASRGLTPEEIGGLTDHRSLLVARDAQRWQEYQATKGRRVAPAKPAPRTVRPGPAPIPAARGNNTNVRAFNERLARNNNDESALHGVLGASGW